MAMADRTLNCAQCGQDFTFGAEDQQYHAERGYQDPKRCPTCRAERRASRGDSGGSYRGERQMFSATCSQCGKEALVPFEPRGDKPVYCSDCFQPRQSRW